MKTELLMSESVLKSNKLTDQDKDVFKGIVSFKGVFDLQVKDGSQPYQV